MDSQHLTIEPELLEFIDKLGAFYESTGIPRISGRIVGLLLVMEVPVSPEDISKILSVSRSSISTSLSLLKAYKFTEEIRYPGDRKEYYKYSDNALENLLKMKLSQYEPFRNILVEGMNLLNKRSMPEKKIEDLLSYMKLEENYISDLLEEWKKFQKHTKQKEP